jgi:hypothetical protein
MQMKLVPTRFVVGVALAGVSSGVVVVTARTPVADGAASGADCAVSGPRGDGPLGTDSFGRRQTVIAARPGEVSGVISDELDAYLKEQGAVLGRREQNGQVSMKAGWVRDRRAAGSLDVTGKRLNRSGGRFRAEVNRLYGGEKFAKVVPSVLFFGSTGCWRIRAKAGHARVTYVVQVRYPRPGEL